VVPLPAAVEPLQTATQCPAEQQQRAVKQLQSPLTGIGQGVVGGLLVIGKRDAVREGLRHSGTMLADVTQLPLRQPQFEPQIGGEGGYKYPRETVHSIHQCHCECVSKG